MSNPYWKRMSSGKYIDLANVTVDDLDIEDIEVSLNYIYRFTGHHKNREPLTVAQHSLLCLHMAEVFEPDEYDLHLAVFMHDFEETYLGDVATPAKKMMGSLWYDFANPIINVVEQKFVPFKISQDMHHRVKLYDLAALDIERRILWQSQYGKDRWPASPLSVGNMEDKQELFDAAQASQFVRVAKIWKELYDKSLHTKKS